MEMQGPRFDFIALESNRGCTSAHTRVEVVNRRTGDAAVFVNDVNIPEKPKNVSAPLPNRQG